MAPRYDSGREWLTEAEIRVLIANEMKPFHEQNLLKFDSLFAALNNLNGSIKTAAWIIGLIVVIVGIVVGVKR